MGIMSKYLVSVTFYYFDVLNCIKTYKAQRTVHLLTATTGFTYPRSQALYRRKANLPIR